METKSPQQCLRSCRIPARLHELVPGQRADDRIPGLGHHSRFGQQRHRLFTRLGGEQRPSGAPVVVGDLDEPGRVPVGQGLRMPGGAAQSRSGTPRSVASDAAAYPPGGGRVAGGEGEGHQVGHEIVAQVPQMVPVDVLAPHRAEDRGRLGGAALGLGGQCEGPGRRVS